MKGLKPQWYWVTRTVGAIAGLYEILFDHGTERGVIIMAAFGLMGVDWVARREPPKPPEGDHNDKSA